MKHLNITIALIALIASSAVFAKVATTEQKANARAFCQTVHDPVSEPTKYEACVSEIVDMLEKEGK